MSFEIRLKAGRWPSKKPEKTHIRILQLFRIANSLRIEHRVLALLHTNNLLSQTDPISSKIRVELFFKQSGFLFECLKKVNQIIKEEKEVTISLSKVIAVINKINESPNNFGSIIKHIRNKLVFHLDEKVIKATWPSMNLDKETRIGLGKSKQKIDFYWSITEQMMLQYIGQKCNGRQDAKLFEELELAVFTFSNELADACNEYAVELLNHNNGIGINNMV